MGKLDNFYVQCDFCEMFAEENTPLAKVIELGKCCNSTKIPIYCKCENCGTFFDVTNIRTRLYCLPACKQAAAYKRKKQKLEDDTNSLI